ncbi:MAG: crotonase/enoyl-CoA hydratase family protein [Halocynthiibacter sp.]
MSDRVTVEYENQIAHVALNRPHKRNALDLDMLEAIAEAGDSLKNRSGIRAVILSGAGDAFCAGLDVATFPKLMEYVAENGSICTRSHANCNLFQYASMVWDSLPMPVIAAVHGYALGAGFQIISGADMRIAAPDTRFSIMESKWGLVPDMGGIALWKQYLRGDVLRRMTYTGEIIDTDMAFNWGVITEIAQDPLARARHIAEDIASRSPDATREAKAMIKAAQNLSEDATLLLESEVQERLIGSPNQMEAVMAGFEKRAPKFKDPS